MAPQRKEIKDVTGKVRRGVVIGVEESSERFSDVRLEDGTLIRIKAAVVEALRTDDEYDDDGNPIYVIQSTNIVRIVEVPDDLKQKVN